MFMMARKLVFTLPIYNEAENLEPLLVKINNIKKHYHSEVAIVAIDDGSQDGSSEILMQYGCFMKRHKTNQGLGRTMADGLREALRLCETEDVIITMDADNTQEPQDAIAMVALIGDQGFALVVGSRYTDGSRQIGVPLHRRWLSTFLNQILRLLFPMEGIRDYTSGYRAYKASLLQEAFTYYGEQLIEESGFAYTVELLLKLRQLNPRATEVGISLRYDRKQGATKIKLGRTILQYLVLLGRMILTRWLHRVTGGNERRT